MAKEPEPLMTPAEMKPLLMLSKRQPVNCAIGLTKDKEGVILLDKKAKPRKMLAMMKKKAGEAKIELNPSTCRFGTAEVDTEVDSRLVTFKVNKEAGGMMRPKLLELLKKSGFGKCEIIVDEGLDAETEEDDTTEEAEPQAAAPARPAAPAEDGAPAPAATAEAGPQDAPAPAATAEAAPEGAQDPAEAAPDPGVITKRLTDLVKRMMGVMGSNPAGADAMKTAAMAGQAALKSGDLEQATASADTLERLLNAGGQGGAQAGAQPAPAGGAKNGPGSVVFGKARLTWVATRRKVEGEIEKLHDELQKTYKGHGVVADLEKVFRSKVEPMMENLDESLADKLDEVSNATDPAEHAKLVKEARDIISKYESYLSSEPMIAQLDTNPFVPLSIEKTLHASLEALNKAVA